VKPPNVPTPPTPQSSALESLQQEKLVEEIRKLKLENQALAQPPPAPPNQSIPIWTACIAAFVALLAPQIVAAKQAAADRRKEMRLALAQYGANYAAAIHHIQWLTWKPANNVSLTASDLDAYDNSMNLLFPPLVGSFLTASALRPDLFSEMKSLNDRIFDIDLKIGQHIAEVRNTWNEDGVLLTELFGHVNTLWNEVPTKFGSFMNMIDDPSMTLHRTTPPYSSPNLSSSA
jgi:hypothetical protein